MDVLHLAQKFRRNRRPCKLSLLRSAIAVDGKMLWPYADPHAKAPGPHDLEIRIVKLHIAIGRCRISHDALHLWRSQRNLVWLANVTCRL